ncbi:MAG: putative RND superfamily exporter protein [Myxococcota bacterium]
MIVVTVAAGLLALLGPLGVSTSRSGLVSTDYPGQARLVAFNDQFGRADASVFVVRGGTVIERRVVVDVLVGQLSTLDGLEGRIMGQVGPTQFAEVMALHRPKQMGVLASTFGTDGTSGLVPVFEHFSREVELGLDGGGSAAPPARLGELGMAFQMLNAALGGGGEDPLATLLTSPAADGAGESVGVSMSEKQTLDDAGYLVGSRLPHHLVVVFPRLTSDEGSVVAPVIDGMRAARDAALVEVAAPHITVELTGLGALATDELRIVQSSINFTSLLTVAGILLLLFLAFRSIRQVIIALVPLGVGVTVTLGAVELLYDDLNLVTSSFLSVLMGLGIDLGVHLLYRYGEDRRAGNERGHAIVSALARSGPGITTGAVTTAVAFLMTTTTDFTAYSELGVVMAIGLLAMLVAAFLLFGPLMRLGREGTVVVSPALPGSNALIALVGRRPWLVVLCAIALTALSVLSFLPEGPGYNGRYFDFLPKDTESYRGLAAVEADGEMGPTVVHSVAGSMEEARALAKELRQLPEVRRVHTASDLFPTLTSKRLAAIRAAVAGLPDDLELRFERAKADASRETLGQVALDLQDLLDEAAFAARQAGHDPAPINRSSASLQMLRETLSKGAGVTERLMLVESTILDITVRALRTAKAIAERGHYAIEDLPPMFRQRFASKDLSALAVYAYPVADVFDAAQGEAFSRAILAVDPNASGMALDAYQHQRLITDGFKQASVYAAIVVLLLLLLVFRRLSDALLAMLPVVVGWVWMVGTMKPIGLTFDVANLVGLPLLLGIGLDAGAHMVHRYRESLEMHGTGRAKLSDLVGGTGAAVVVSSLTTMVGFGALMAGEYGAMQSLGLLLVIGIAWTLVSSVILLPAVLVVLGRAER